MKFVCTECDEPMKFEQRGELDDDGSMSATFRCPSCEWGVTLLINPQETQMVRSLGVKIGGSTVAAQPMEMLQTHLVGAPGSLTESSSEGGSSCPFAAMLGDIPAVSAIPGGPQWSAEAQQRLERAPSFVQAMVRRGVEDFARTKGYTEITTQVMDEARASMGM
ncbi:MAG: PCP reductase family protein [Candidatus Tectimicrobiota bacterium]